MFRHDVMYFPHNLDFRGRVYPIPPHLNHMGADLSRYCFACFICSCCVSSELRERDAFSLIVGVPLRLPAVCIILGCSTEVC